MSDPFPNVIHGALNVCNLHTKNPESSALGDRFPAIYSEPSARPEGRQCYGQTLVSLSCKDDAVVGARHAISSS